MNFSLPDFGGTLLPFLEDPHDSEDRGRPYLKCLALLHWRISFLIVL